MLLPGLILIFGGIIVLVNSSAKVNAKDSNGNTLREATESTMTPEMKSFRIYITEIDKKVLKELCIAHLIMAIVMLIVLALFWWLGLL